MATGQTMFDSSTQQVDAGFAPYEPGEYSWKLLGGKCEIARKEGGFPRIKTRWQLIDGENKYTLLHDFHLSLKPGKDGKLMPNRADGIVAFAQANGLSFQVPMVTVQVDGKPYRCLAAKATLEWLKGLDGTVVRARIKTEAASEGYDARSRVAAWLEGEEGGEEEAAPSEEETEDVAEAASEDAGEEPAEEEGEVEESGEAPQEEEQEGEEEAQEELPLEEEAEFEPVPAPKVATKKAGAPPKPAVKVAKKAGKVVKKKR